MNRGILVCVIVGILLCTIICGCSNTSEEQNQLDTLTSAEIDKTDTQISKATAQDIVKSLYVSDLYRHSWGSYNELYRCEIAEYAFCRMQLVDKVPEPIDGFYYLPADEFEFYAQKYMDIPKDWMRSGFNWYDDVKNEYQCDDRLYFLPKNKDLTVTDISQDGETATIKYQIKRNNKIIYSNIVTLERSIEDWRLLSNIAEYRDLVRLCSDINLCGVDYDFKNPNELSDEQLFNFGMWVIDYDRMSFEKWEEWSDEDGTSVPVSLISKALENRLGEVDFDPIQIPKYDASTDTICTYIGGYGGVRNPKLREKTAKDGTITLVVDYYGMEENEEKIYCTRIYRLAVDEHYNWKLLSAYSAE